MASSTWRFPIYFFVAWRWKRSIQGVFMVSRRIHPFLLAPRRLGRFARPLQRVFKVGLRNYFQWFIENVVAISTITSSETTRAWQQFNKFARTACHLFPQGFSVIDTDSKWRKHLLSLRIGRSHYGGKHNILVILFERRLVHRLSTHCRRNVVVCNGNRGSTLRQSGDRAIIPWYFEWSLG